ncbi:MAG: hypothetical protein JHD16_13385 [Solirubrobacteraceae bacterium]|nr:hypothetical protein [Solirubrobacteraceae bacterium]
MTASFAPAANILNNVNGLPTHALLVHFTVVVATAGAIGGLAYVLVPAFRRWLSFPLLAVGVFSVILGIVTPSSGEQLEARVEESALLETHTELGDQMGTILIAYGLLLIATMLLVRYRGSATDDASTPRAPTTLDRIGAFPGEAPRAFSGQSQVTAALTALVLVGSVTSGVWIVRAGDAGAKSVWDDTPATPIRPGG